LWLGCLFETIQVKLDDVAVYKCSKCDPINVEAIKSAIVMAFNMMGSSREVTHCTGDGCFSAIVHPYADQRAIARQVFATGKVRLAPCALLRNVNIPRPGSIIKNDDTKVSVKVAGLLFGTKVCHTVVVGPPMGDPTNGKTDNDTFVNVYWLVKRTRDTKLVNMKCVVEHVDIGGVTVTFPSMTNTKDIAVGDALYAKASALR
jgi:hypothetical protein